jgi:invasion protein IalB
MPTTLGGSFLKVSTSASRLILRRKAILPSVLKPTTWKTSLPMSMPIEARGGMLVVPWAASPVDTVDLQALSYTPWTKTCLEGTCFVWSDGHSNPDCGSVVSAVLIRRPGEAKNALHVTLPPRVNTERGVRIIIDQSKPIERLYASCFAVGCRAEYEGGAELVDQLKRGRILTLEAVDKANSPISVTVTLVGFADAYDGASHGPKVFETTQEKLKAEIDERKARCGTGENQ